MRMLHESLPLILHIRDFVLAFRLVEDAILASPPKVPVMGKQHLLTPHLRHKTTAVMPLVCVAVVDTKNGGSRNRGDKVMQDVKHQP